jgi:antibiotic biosynthesis monooxygenase (ABM) superfamily enzyme
MAITRRVRPGCEEAFLESLREFLGESFREPGVLGASLIVPAPGSSSSEYGILRTFADERDREAFYASPRFAAWEEKSRALAESDWESRKLTGLEAWFRSPEPPPRWKMALLTWLAVWPVSMAVQAVLLPAIGDSVPRVLRSAVVAAAIVVVLTWGAMPLVVSAAKEWLQGRR